MTNEAFMSLEINDILFKNILDNLYSDIPLAVVRELCCNAADSHRVANNLEPFLVQAPDEHKPLIVRDFGTGLSKEDVFLYLNKLMSGSKKDETDLTGKYGLGSKVVLALVDEYYIYSYFEGIRYDFMFKRIERGVPLLTCIGEHATEEPNGLKYVINFTNKRHLETVRSKLNILKYFRLKPKVLEDIENLDSELPDFKNYKLEPVCSNIYFIDSFNSFNKYTVFIRLGDIIYPVTPRGDLDTFLYWVASSTKDIIIDIDVDILELPMNREALSDSPENNARLREIFNNVLADSVRHYLSIANEVLNTNYQDFQDLKEAPYFDIIKVGMVFFNKFNLDIVNILLNKCSTLNSSTRERFGGYNHNYTNVKLPEYMQNFYLQGMVIYRKNPSRPVASLNLYSNISILQDKKIIAYTDYEYARSNKVNNYMNTKRDEIIYCNLQWFMYRTPEDLNAEEKEYFKRFYSEYVFLINGSELEFVRYSDIVEESEAYHKEAAKQKRRAARLVRETNPVNREVTNLLGIRRIRPDTLISNIYKSIQSTTTYAIPDQRDDDGKIIPFNADYFPNARKFLVLPNKGYYGNQLCSYHVFDEVLYVSPTRYDSVLEALRENPDNLVLTLETIRDYPLLNSEELEDFLPSINKWKLNIAINHYFNKVFSELPEEFSDILIEKLLEISEDKDLIELLENTNIPVPHTYISSQITDNNARLKHNKFIELADKTEYYPLIKSVFTKDFMINNKENTVDIISDVTVLRNLINDLISQT